MISPVGHSAESSRRYWKPAELRRLRRLYPNMENGAIGKLLGRSWSAVQNMAVKIGLRKSAAFLNGPECRFQRGMTPWNLGKTGYMGANRTSFRKGNRPQTWLPVGTERVNQDGTLERKVRNPNRWKPLKDIIWESAHGRIRRGWFVVHKDRNRQNFDLRNLTLVDRAENMRLNTYHRYPKEIARLIQLRGALNRQINRRDREEQNRGLAQSPVRSNREGEGRRHATGPRKGGSGAGASHHQQRQGGNRAPKGARQDARHRVYPRGNRKHAGTTEARQA